MRREAPPEDEELSMPTYDYQSLKTGEYFVFKQSFSDDAYTHHPETGEPVKRIISAPAVIFKGSGWYAKDSKSSNSRATAPVAKTDGADSTTAPAESTPAEAAKPLPQGETPSAPKAAE